MQSSKVRVLVLSWREVVAGVVLGLAMVGGVAAQDASRLVIAGYGAILPTKDVATAPDPSLSYRVAFISSLVMGNGLPCMERWNPPIP